MIEFVPATTADLPKIVAIYNETIPTHQATADLQPQLLTKKLIGLQRTMIIFRHG